MRSCLRGNAILAMCLWASMAHSAGFLKKCLIAIGLYHAPQKKIIDPASLPQIVTAPLQEATYRMFELGPNQWVQTGQKPKGVGFQRGFGGISPTRGAREALETLVGSPLDTRAHVFRLDTQKDKKSADRSAGIFSAPITIRGKIAADKLDAPRDIRNTNEATVSAGTELAPQISDMAIIYKPVGNSISVLDATTRIEWGKAYLEVYQKLKASGMILDPQSRGGKFSAELEELYSNNTPVIPNYMSSQDGSFDRFYRQNIEFISRLEEILKRYQ